MTRREREIVAQNSNIDKVIQIAQSSNTVVRDWNKLLPSVVQRNSIASFKNNLARYLLHLSVHSVSKLWWPHKNSLARYLLHLSVHSVSMLWWPHKNTTTVT